MSRLLQSLVFGALVSICLCRYAVDTSKRAVTAVSDVSNADQTVILNVHNNYRKGVSPAAKDMRQVYWSGVLANLAQQWANECQFGHDNSYQRRIQADIGLSIGQNAASDGDYTNVNWTKQIEAWHKEVKDFVYGTGASPSTATVGHYTQVVWGKTALIGCGQKQCDASQKRIYVCNYALGNLGLTHPYLEGASCADCNGKCVEEKLCDCPDGLMCKNGGVLNMETCTCDCQYGWTGTTCETCPAVDQDRQCGTSSYVLSNCASNSFLPNNCPVVCQICEDKCGGTLKVDSCKNGGTLNIQSSGCTCTCAHGYTGDTCETAGPCADNAGICKSVNSYSQYDSTWCTKPGWESAFQGYCPTMCKRSDCV